MSGELEQAKGAVAVHPLTGEALDLGGKEPIALMETLAAARELHAAIGEYEAAVSSELVRRMDAAASWTMREGQYEVSAPSPAAGVVNYPPDELERVLHELLAARTIAEPAAAAALRRRLVIEVEPPFGLDIRQLAEDVSKSQIFLAGQPMENTKAEWTLKASQRGIDALKKVPAAAKALDGVSIAVMPPRRKATVKVKP